MYRLRTSGIFNSHRDRGLNSARPYVPAVPGNEGNKSGDTVCTMIDLILGEIEKEIIRVENESEKMRKETLRKNCQPDYEWLIDYRLKPKKFITFLESSEIESLCLKLDKGEWTKVLGEWRTRVQLAISRREIIDEFRSTVSDTIEERFKNTSLHQIDEVELAERNERESEGGLELKMMKCTGEQNQNQLLQRRQQQMKSSRPATGLALDSKKTGRLKLPIKELSAASLDAGRCLGGASRYAISLEEGDA